MPLDRESKRLLLTKLASIGEEAYELRKEDIAPQMPSLDTTESKLRYLLLWALLNQRTEAKIAGSVTNALIDEFQEKLFYDPVDVLKRFNEVSRIFQRFRYPVRFAYLTRDAVASLLVQSYLDFMIKLNATSSNMADHAQSGPQKFEAFLKSEKLLAPLGEKARRMYISFVGHPKIGLTEIKYSKGDLFLFVDGTVAKVFARTGLSDHVRRYSGNQVYAKAMRPDMDKLVRLLAFEDPVMVDIGAWTLGQGCCDDSHPGCDGCRSVDSCLIHRGSMGRCPLSALGCLRRIEWKAYSTT